MSGRVFVNSVTHVERYRPQVVIACRPGGGASYLLCGSLDKETAGPTGGAREAQCESCSVIHEEGRGGRKGASL